MALGGHHHTNTPENKHVTTDVMDMECDDNNGFCQLNLTFRQQQGVMLALLTGSPKSSDCRSLICVLLS